MRSGLLEGKDPAAIDYRLKMFHHVPGAADSLWWESLSEKQPSEGLEVRVARYRFTTTENR